jgi:hypothetical protein
MKRVALCLAAMGLLCLAADQALAQRTVSRSTTTSRIVVSNRISGSTVQSRQPSRTSYSISSRVTRSSVEYRTPTWRRPTATVSHGRGRGVVTQPSFDDRIQNYLPPNVSRFLGSSRSFMIRY